MADWAQLYRDHVVAVTALADDLTDDDLATTVPATPAWTVRDVIAHLAGCPADIVTGRMDGAPTPEWTARHVSERIGLTVADLVAEIHEHQEALIAAVADRPRPAPIWDIAVHHADLQEALGRGELPLALWRPVLDAAAQMMLGERPVTVRTDPDDAGYGAVGTGSSVLTVPAYELWRALFSRRSRRQIAAWAGHALSADDICVFGPRDDDQPVPD
jgi:uncharacterized protein (TIGR03083 family)